MSSKSPRQEIALLKFDGGVLLPTVLDRLGPWTSNKGLLYDNFRVPHDEAADHSFDRRYRQFKIDLTLTDGELSDRQRERWGMLSLRNRHGKSSAGMPSEDPDDGGAEMYLRDDKTKRRYYFSGLQAAEVFLYRLCRHAVSRARDLFPRARDIKVHFTVPAYGEDTEGESAGLRYRNNLKEAIQRFSTNEQVGRHFENVEFRITTRRSRYQEGP